MECPECLSEDPILLHSIRYRGRYRQLCTACVLRRHTGFFCPICYQVYDNFESPPPHLRAVCVYCPAVAHLHCLPPSAIASHYQCPSCSTPDFSFFNLTLSESSKPITQDSAIQLVAAAKIASHSLHRAAAIARFDAEEKAQEAVRARRRAKEALDRVAFLMGNNPNNEDAGSRQTGRAALSLEASRKNSSNRRLLPRGRRNEDNNGRRG